MKVTFQSKYPCTDAACKAATGKTLAQWFSILDANDGIDKGRRESVSILFEPMGKDTWWAVTVAVEYEKSKNIKKKDGLYEGYGICPTKTIAAPVAKIFKALSDAKLLNQWYGTKVEAKVEDGGKFTTADGESGDYLRVRNNKDLRFTWNHTNATAPTQVDISFMDKKDKVTVMVNHSRIQTRAEADGLHAAWSEALDRLKALVEGKG